MEKKNIILLISILALSFLAGLADGTRDVLSFRYGQSVFPQEDGETVLAGLCILAGVLGAVSLVLYIFEEK